MEGVALYRILKEKSHKIYDSIKVLKSFFSPSPFNTLML